MSNPRTRMEERVAELERQLAARQENQSRASQKIEKYGNESSDDWLVFKHHIETVCRLNGYNDLQSRLALAASMTGKAALATLDINPRQRVDGVDITFTQLLALFEARFLPGSASQMARIRFDAARQGPNEAVLEFHSRLRALHNKAYPNANDDVNLIRKFTMGLRRKELRMQVMRSNPDTYANALELAQNEASVLQMVKVTELGASLTNEEPMEIGSLEEPQQRTGDCHFCESNGHWKRDCPLWKKAQQLLKGGRQGSNGRPNQRGKGRDDNKTVRRRLIAALDAARATRGRRRGRERHGGRGRRRVCIRGRSGGVVFLWPSGILARIAGPETEGEQRYKA